MLENFIFAVADLLSALWYGSCAVAAGAGAVALAPVSLTAVGFTSAGIAAGSYAAGMMSATAGGVAAGSAVAVAQSVGKFLSFDCIILIARFMGPTWGPSGPCRSQMGPMLAPWTLLSGMTW